MIHSARSATALLALLASLTLQVTAEDEPQVTYELKYQFAAGQVLEYSVEDAKTIDVQVGDVADAVQQTLELGQVLRVDSIDADGNALIEARIDYAKLAADHQEEHIEWDSRSGEEPADEFRAIAETIGKPLGTVRLSPKGEGRSCRCEVRRRPVPKSRKLSSTCSRCCPMQRLQWEIPGKRTSKSRSWPRRP